ncbi:hypothetical protein ACIRBX_25385 [Kitasatospora sp. NPDC096147]|uniref:hypothetical protein n=1 Tax=Kitasatospora sp. NPDC096147 TaxID=3364093 RepID=UPI0038292935
MPTPGCPAPPATPAGAPPPRRRVRDVTALILLALGTSGLNAAAYTTDPRLGLACTSLAALAVAAVLGHDNEQQ